MKPVIARINGVEIECSSTDDLRAVLQLAQELNGGPMPTTSTPPPRAPSAAEPTERTARPPHKKERGISDAAWLRHSWRIVRLLIDDREHHAVGKLTISIADGLGIGKSMLRVLLSKLSELDLVEVGEAGRGVSPFVRLRDLDVAEEFATRQEAVYRESLETELKKMELKKP